MSGGFVDVKAALASIHDQLAGAKTFTPWPDSGSGGTPNMKRLRALRPLLEHGDPAPMLAFLASEELTGHCFSEPFSSSHGQLHVGAMGAATWYESKHPDIRLYGACVRWWQREFQLCRLLDTQGRGLVDGGSWGPGARDKDPVALVGNNKGRDLAYLVARGGKLREGQAADKGNSGAYALSLLPKSELAVLLQWPAELKLVNELRVARRGKSGSDYVAWFPSGLNALDAALAAGVWDGEIWISATVDAGVKAKITECGPPIVVPGV